MYNLTCLCSETRELSSYSVKNHQNSITILPSMISGVEGIKHIFTVFKKVDFDAGDIASPRISASSRSAKYIASPYLIRKTQLVTDANGLECDASRAISKC